MAAQLLTATSLLAVRIVKCQHLPTDRNSIICIENRRTLLDVFEDSHGKLQNGYDVTVTCNTSVDTSRSTSFNVQPNMLVGDLVASFNIKHLEFSCSSQQQEATANLEGILNKAAEEATKKTVDAFYILMSGGRKRVATKTSSSKIKDGLSSKDEIYNKLVLKFFNARNLDFPKATCEKDGAYFVQVLCNALWYITNHHLTINDASMRKHAVLPIPKVFDDFDGYNDLKRKKMKSCQLSASLLDSHAQALYALLMKPVVNSSTSWKEGAEDIKQLADCLIAYKEYLIVQNETAQANQSQLHPVRTIDKEATIEFRRGNLVGQIRDKYIKINEAGISAGIMGPVIFYEFVHLADPFENNTQRYRFFQDLQLKCHVYIIRFSPGGSSVSTVCIVKVTQEIKLEPEMLTQGARILQSIRPKLKEFHTRAQRRMFREKLKNVAKVLPSVANLIYEELALDASAAEHPVTQERPRLIFLGQNDLFPDLRVLKPGRPGNTFDVFFKTLSKEVEKITVADDRRHGTAHLSEFISLEELVEKTAKSCPEGTVIPSKSLVRLQFAPRNPYAKSAWNFTGKIDVQYKVQRRQLRIDHHDDHFCNAQFRYLKEMAIEMRDHCKLLFCDDKAKVSVGEPGSPVSTGVRGNKSIVPTSTTLASLDHDMTKASLTPSVILQCKIPQSIDKSFVRGQVTVSVNDSVCQMSSPF